MSIKVSKKDIGWNYINLFLTTAINIVLLPFILQKLSSYEMGIWYVFTSFGSLAVLIDFGFSTTISRNVTFVWCGAKEISKEGFQQSAQKDKPNFYLLYKLISTSRVIYLILASVVFVGLATIGTLFIVTSAKGQVAPAAYLPAWGVYLLSVVMNIYFAYWVPLLKGIGAIKESNQVVVLSKLIQLFLSIIGLYMGYGLIAVSMSYFVGNLMMRVAAIYLFNHYQNVNEELKQFKKMKIPFIEKKELFLSVWPNAYKQGLISLSNFIQKRAITLICSASFGLEVASMVGITQQIIDIIMSIGNALFNTYIPSMSYERINGNLAKLKDYYLKASGISFVMILFGGIAAIVISPILLDLINSDTSLLPFWVSLILLVENLLINNHTLAGAFIATGNKMPMYKAYIITSIVTVLLQLLFVNFTALGVFGVVLSGLISNIVYNNWYWPMLVCKELSMSAWNYIVELFLAPTRMLVGMGAALLKR